MSSRAQAARRAEAPSAAAAASVTPSATPSAAEDEEQDAAVAFRYPEAGGGRAGWAAGGAAGWAADDAGQDGAGGPEERARAAGQREGEERARAWYAAELAGERERMTRALAEFARQRAEYFRNVEREAVELTLRIAGKVLEREARLDPLAVAALVHVALGSLAGGTAVTLRVHPAAAQDWRLHFAARAGAAGAGSSEGWPGGEAWPSVVEDASLAPGECVVETAMGRAEIGLRGKLEEIEQGFLELLAQRPEPA